jgi:RNA polymerase sigma factor (sigma-70 family)
VTDTELLSRYTHQRDDDAFATLVQRYGSLVYGTCYRIALERMAAEDAYQATFLVLSQRINEVPTEALPRWLHVVALRVALKAREASQRRTLREHRSARPEGIAASEHQFDLLAKLDVSVQQLPEPYRQAILVGELQGLNRRLAAEHLGIPQGTLSSRLAEARKRLKLAFESDMLASTMAIPASLVAFSSVDAATASAQALAKVVQMGTNRSWGWLVAAALMVGLPGMWIMNQTGPASEGKAPEAKVQPIVPMATKPDENTLWVRAGEWPLPRDFTQANLLRFSPDGKTLVTQSNYPQAKPLAWDVSTLKSISLVFPKNNDRREFVCFRPDGKLVWQNEYASGLISDPGNLVEITEMNKPDVVQEFRVRGRLGTVTTAGTFALTTAPRIPPLAKDEKGQVDTHYVVNLMTGTAVELPWDFYVGSHVQLTNDGNTLILGQGTDYAPTAELPGILSAYDVTHQRYLWKLEKFSDSIPRNFLVGSKYLLHVHPQRLLKQTGLVGPTIFHLADGKSYLPPGWNVRSPLAEFTGPQNPKMMRSGAIAITPDDRWMGSVITYAKKKLKITIMDASPEQKHFYTESHELSLSDPNQQYENDALAITSDGSAFACFASTTTPDPADNTRRLFLNHRVYLWKKREGK